MIPNKEENITSRLYYKLSKEDRTKHIAVYKTKKIRKRSECESCGHFLGYYQGDKNIGKPIYYRKKTIFEIGYDLMVSDMVNATLNNPLFKG